MSRVRVREVTPTVDLPTFPPAVEPVEPPKPQAKRKPVPTEHEEESP